jgi:hypothetical protein
MMKSTMHVVRTVLATLSTNTRHDRRRASKLIPIAAEAPTAAASVGVA